LEDNILYIEKYDNNKKFSIAHFDGEQQEYYIKRFHLIPEDKSGILITENQKSKLIILSSENFPAFQIQFKDKNTEPEIIDVEQFISIKSYKARGNKASSKQIAKIKEVEALQKEAYEPSFDSINDDEISNSKNIIKDVTENDDSQMTLEL
jgi:topoisomerase-4 subunit A